MHHLMRRTRIMAGFLAIAFVCAGLVAPQPAFAGTTGNITGTITDASSGAPLANVKVTAVSLSQTATSTSDAKGFYSIVDIAPDTYTVTFARTGYESATAAGVTVVQDQTVTVNQQLHVALRTIASVHSSAQSNLVKPNQGSDVYTVGGAELQAATNPGDLHETLYQYLAATPGVTGTGFPAQPRVRGGQVTDLGYEFEGIPIQDRITGFFTTNLSNIGISNIEVYTGGLPASGATNGTGFFNSVLKTGTYPAFTNAFLQVTSPEANHYVTLERGAATIDHRFSYYVGFDGVNSTNQYDYGENTYPNLVMRSFDGAGPVKTRDWVSNFVYRPDPADTFQAVLTNSNGDFIFDYLLNKAPGSPPALALNPCAGNVPSNASFTGWGGGVAPNGQTCPTGLYFGSLPNGGGNIWHHYGGLGKIQWNHNLNDHSFFTMRLAENFNQYIFDQPMADPNYPNLENAGGGWNWAEALGLPASACPAYPYTPGSPVQIPVGDGGPNGDICAQDDGVEVFWGDRNSHMYIGNFDYTNALSAKTTLKFGGSYERDYNVYNYFCKNVFNSDGSWPDNYLRSIYPSDIYTAYAEDDFHAGKFLFEPGLEYAAEHYAFPINGGMTQSIVNPTFNGTYTFDPNNVLRFSWGDTSSFVGTGYIYRTTGGSNPVVSGTYNPTKSGFSFAPQQNHSADIMWEHQFDANTSLRVGPYWNKTNNYYGSYRPVISMNPLRFGNTVLSNFGRHQTFGIEFGLNHVNNMPRGMSWWISGTYDNYWTSNRSLPASYVNTPLPPNIVLAGQLVRVTGNPLMSGSIVADYHSDRFHLDPLLYWQNGTFYNTGVTCGPSTAAYICAPESIAGGYIKVSLEPWLELGPKRNVIVGLKVDNLFNNNNDIIPCVSDGTGCYPFNGPYSGVVTAPGTSIYQNYSSGPRTFYVFGGIRM